MTRSPLLLALSSLILPCLAAPLAAQWSECHKLLPGGGLAGDVFGSAVATDGARVAVGAPSADVAGTDSGSAYVFAVPTGAQLLELAPANGAAGDRFGASVAIDGARVLVGAPLADRVGADSGTVYVFDATTGIELFELQPGDAAAGAQFGYSVAMDGGRAAIGGLATAYVFDVSTGQELAKLVPGTPGGGFGEAVDIDGGRVVVGARTQNGVSGFAGAAYVFDAASGNELHRLIATNGTAWSFFGAAVSIDGNVIAIGAPEAYGGVGKHSGVAFVFDASSGQQVHYIFPSYSPNGGHVFAKFGSSVAVDGPNLFVGSERNNVLPVASAGAVYLYDALSGSQVAKLAAGDPASLDYFGAAAAAAGGILVAGAPRDDDLGDASGSAYVFDAAGCPCDPGLATYCTAKPGLACGVPAITATGAPSASAASGFTIRAAPARANKTGILLYTDSGRATLPFPAGGHVLCIQVPLRRGGPADSGGTPGGCDGVFALDMNAFAAGLYAPGFPTHAPAAFLSTPGQRVNCQWWGRDSVSTGSFMSNALEYVVCP